jgi:hypothetical protein
MAAKKMTALKGTLFFRGWLELETVLSSEILQSTYKIT